MSPKNRNQICYKNGRNCAVLSIMKRKHAWDTGQPPSGKSVSDWIFCNRQNCNKKWIYKYCGINWTANYKSSYGQVFLYLRHFEFHYQSQTYIIRLKHHWYILLTSKPNLICGLCNIYDILILKRPNFFSVLLVSYNGNLDRWSFHNALILFTNM